MRKNQIHRIIGSIILMAGLLYSCEDIVEVKLDNGDLNLIVVEAYINNQASNNIWVKIEKSLEVNDTKKNPPLNNATVEISDDLPTPTKVTLKEQGQSGIYMLPKNTSYKAEPGKTYKLKITTKEGTVITGEDYMQEINPIDSININLSPRGNYEFLAVFINSQEKPGLKHYYKWDIHINNTVFAGERSLIFQNDELVDGNYISNFEIFTDWYDEDEGEKQVLLIGDTIAVSQSSISQNIHDFYVAVQNQAFAGSPFSVPPANLPSNLSSSDGKKVLGIFSASDISFSNSIVIDSTNYTPIGQ